MRLGTKVLLAIILTWVVIVGCTYLGSLRILQKSYTSLETQQIQTNFVQVNNAIDKLLAINDKYFIGDSNWDDIYATAVEKDAVKIKKLADMNYSPSALGSGNIDLVMVYNLQGILIIANNLSPDRTKLTPLPDGITNLFQPQGKLRKLIVPPTNAKGIIETSRGFLVLETGPILTTKGEGTTHGTFISGIYITDDVWNKVRTDTKLDLKLYSAAQIQENLQLKTVYQELLLGNSAKVLTNEHKMYLYHILKDIKGDPIAMVTMIAPRNIHQLGIKTIHYFTIAFIAVGIIFSLFLYYLLRILIINRLKKINQRVVQIGSEKDFSLRVPDEGSDELASVAREINKMLDVIQEVESQLLGTISSMPSAILIVDNKFNITHLNQMAEKEAGVSIRESEGKYLFDFFPFLKDYSEKMALALKNKKQMTDRLVLHAAEGERYFNIVIYPLVHSQEKNIAIRMDDISDRIRIGQRLVQGDKLAAIGTLTAGVAAEINAPIHSIVSAIVLLKQEKEELFKALEKYVHCDSIDKYKQLEEIERRTQAAVAKINQLLDITKTDADRVVEIVKNLQTFSRLDEDALKKINLLEGLDATLALLQHSYKDRIRVLKEYEKIPLVDCYPGRINQVFMSILSNAIESISGKGEIIIKTKPQGTVVSISFKDTGEGISQENMAKICDPFFTTKGKAGIGLSVASSIIKEHGGKLEIQSVLGKGSEFVVVLPVETSMSVS